MKLTFLDEWYPDAWSRFRSDKYISEPEIFCHGTSNYMDCVLRQQGHESGTLILNKLGGGIMNVAEDAKPDVIVSQNAGRWNAEYLNDRFPDCKKVAFVSYRASDEDMTGWDCVFTSFPWLVDHLESIGQRADLLPLAFGRQVLSRVEWPKHRDLPLTFVGGIGHNHIWSKGTYLLTKVAETFPDKFQWWGYRPKDIPEALEKSYQGEAWGPKYFEILMRSQITLNRHGEIAKGCVNNMRLFEATGCGACLVTDNGTNLKDYFTAGVQCMSYDDVDDLIYILRNLIDCPEAVEKISRQGQEHTLKYHCYDNRVDQFLDVVESL